MFAIRRIIPTYSKVSSDITNYIFGDADYIASTAQPNDVVIKFEHSRQKNAAASLINHVEQLYQTGHGMVIPNSKVEK